MAFSYSLVVVVLVVVMTLGMNAIIVVEAFQSPATFLGRPRRNIIAMKYSSSSYFDGGDNIYGVRWNEPGGRFSQPSPASSSSSSSSTSVSSSPPLDLNSPYYKAALARVVVAAAAAAAAAYNHHPSGILDVRQVVDVFVMLVDDQHMELQATICNEPEYCDIVNVPVVFPRPCSGTNNSNSNSNNNSNQHDNFGASSNNDDVEECLLENLEHLDFEADQMLQQAEWEALNNNHQQQYQSYEQVVPVDNGAKYPQSRPNNNDIHHYDQQHRQQRQQQPLGPDGMGFPGAAAAAAAAVNGPPPVLPTWWIQPQTWEMADECTKLLQWLNKEKFQKELQAMVTFRLGMEHRRNNNIDNSVVVVDRAMIRAVGPGGFVAQANVRQGLSEQQSQLHSSQQQQQQQQQQLNSNNNYNYNYNQMEVPISFPEPARSAEHLRDLVMQALDFAGGFQKK